MAAQVLYTGGRLLFKDARGRFISRAKYELLQRKDPLTGRFMSAAKSRLRPGAESQLRFQLGAPPAGKSWLQIAEKYSERFEDFLQGLEL